MLDHYTELVEGGLIRSIVHMTGDPDRPFRMQALKILSSISGMFSVVYTSMYLSSWQLRWMIW